MNNYDSNVAVVLDFLKANSYGTTAVCAHKRCYKQLKEFLIYFKFFLIGFYKHMTLG